MLLSPMSTVGFATLFATREILDGGDKEHYNSPSCGYLSSLRVIVPIDQYMPSPMLGWKVEGDERNAYSAEPI